MPRKPPLLSTQDLQTIINGRCGDVPFLKDWASGELERRDRAGKHGGRPKDRGSSKQTHEDDHYKIVPFEEA